MKLGSSRRVGRGHDTLWPTGFQTPWLSLRRSTQAPNCGTSSRQEAQCQASGCAATSRWCPTATASSLPWTSSARCGRVKFRSCHVSFPARARGAPLGRVGAIRAGLVACANTHAASCAPGPGPAGKRPALGLRAAAGGGGLLPEGLGARHGKPRTLRRGVRRGSKIKIACQSGQVHPCSVFLFCVLLPPLAPHGESTATRACEDQRKRLQWEAPLTPDSEHRFPCNSVWRSKARG